MMTEKLLKSAIDQTREMSSILSDLSFSMEETLRTYVTVKQYDNKALARAMISEKEEYQNAIEAYKNNCALLGDLLDAAQQRLFRKLEEFAEEED